MSREFYRLSCYKEGRIYNFPYAISGGLEQDTKYRGCAERVNLGDIDVLQIPARHYSQELHARIIELGNERELFIEHGVMDRSGFRSDSGVPREIEMIKVERLPTEAQLQQNKPWWEKIFASNCGAAVTIGLTAGIVTAGFAALLHFRLGEKASSQSESPEAAAEVQNGLTSQAQSKR